MSREEGRSLSDGEERPYASTYLQQFVSVLEQRKIRCKANFTTPQPHPGCRLSGEQRLAFNAGRFFVWLSVKRYSGDLDPQAPIDFAADGG